MANAYMELNLKVAVVDQDYYARQAINGYLAWDRRTRVSFMGETTAALDKHLRTVDLSELPDVAVINATQAENAAALRKQIEDAREAVTRRRANENLLVVCLAQNAVPDLIQAAAAGGAKGFLLKAEIGVQIAWAIVVARRSPFILTSTAYDALRRMDAGQRAALSNARRLPGRRDYPELTDRVKEALELCVVRGMSAQLAADEMGIAPSTVRGYVKKGYRALEIHDNTPYPDEMSASELAFMRYTAFAEE